MILQTQYIPVQYVASQGGQVLPVVFLGQGGTAQSVPMSSQSAVGPMPNPQMRECIHIEVQDLLAYAEACIIIFCFFSASRPCDPDAPPSYFSLNASGQSQPSAQDIAKVPL